MPAPPPSPGPGGAGLLVGLAAFASATTRSPRNTCDIRVDRYRNANGRFRPGPRG